MFSLCDRSPKHTQPLNNKRKWSWLWISECLFSCKSLTGRNVSVVHNTSQSCMRDKRMSVQVDVMSPCRTRVVSPIMDVIDWQTFQYNATQWPVRGVFDWRLDFHWESNPQLQDKDPESAVQPLRWDFKTDQMYLHFYVYWFRIFCIWKIAANESDVWI